MEDDSLPDGGHEELLQKPCQPIGNIQPKDMGGTLRRLWNLTAGHRQGLGWILLLSALASASSILSPLLSAAQSILIDGGDRALWLWALLFGL